MNKNQANELSALYERVIQQMDEMQCENLYYLKPEWNILNAQKQILLEVQKIVHF